MAHVAAAGPCKVAPLLHVGGSRGKGGRQNRNWKDPVQADIRLPIDDAAQQRDQDGQAGQHAKQRFEKIDHDAQKKTRIPRLSIT